LISGNVDMMFDGLGSSANHIKGGRIKALMVSGTKRNPAFPDVPCAGELGLPDYTVTTWYGMWAPKGTPADVQARIVEDLRKAASHRRAQGHLGQQRRRLRQPHAPAVRRFVSSEVKRWSAVVKASGAKLE
jgi:tripartite-type tricarboxylate transporter receptor subunit TctC